MSREFLRGLRTQSSHPEVELKPEYQDQLLTDPAMHPAAGAATALKALAQVDDDYRMVLELFYLADLSYKEIADTLDIPIGTVMSRLSRGKEQLKTLLAKTSAVDPKPLRNASLDLNAYSKWTKQSVPVVMPIAPKPKPASP